MDTSARQRGFGISFPLLGELPKAIEPHLPVCQLHRWQLGLNMWSSPTTKSLDPIIVTALRVGFPGESHGPVTCGFASNCPESEAWTTEALGQSSMISKKGYQFSKVQLTLLTPLHRPLPLLTQQPLLLLLLMLLLENNTRRQRIDDRSPITASEKWVSSMREVPRL